MGQDFQALINDCISGDQLAQKKLYNRFSPGMYGVCLMYSRDTEEAKDILQEGFIKIFQKLNQFSGKGSLEGWMRRIFINSALEKFRVKKAILLVDEDMEVLAGEVDDKIIDLLSAKDLLQMIQDLSPQYRLVFNLYAIEGYSHKEISKRLNISVGTSKSNLSRARSILQEKVITLRRYESGDK
ncbi:MAG: sigma-70 family RNA polymerase sigma factor [Bacteroidales bacterium]|nr:sigma-70 family RNA polymerase sigma factor [Bacteroidales bacterium]